MEIRKMIAKNKGKQIQKKNLLFFVLHHTGTNTDCASYLASPGDDRPVSVHFHINRKGLLTIYTNLVDLDNGKAWEAWHAGDSKWKEYTGLNHYSLGVEIDGDGETPFTSAQYSTLLELSKLVIEKFGITIDNIVMHKQIAPKRKVDPSPFDLPKFKESLKNFMNISDEKLDEKVSKEVLQHIRKIYELRSTMGFTQTHLTEFTKILDSLRNYGKLKDIKLD